MKFDAGRKTRIVCTIGPASSSPEVMEQLLRAGMNVARLNFSHGEHATHAENFQRLREASKAVGKPLAILQDLCGPKIRLGDMEPDVRLAPGDTFLLTPSPVLGNKQRAHVSYEHLARDLRPGDRVLIDDGLVELRVKDTRGDEVETEVLLGGLIKSHKGVNLPGARLAIPALTPKDDVDLRFGLQLGVDLVALSFVRSATDLDPVRAIMREVGIQRPVVVKVEKAEAVADLEGIVLAADAVMVARGDLGIEMALEEVPMVQKRLIHLCIQHNRPVITATQMLESMISAPTPTRAEVNDIANAILDGTDAVMLSAETAAGAFPVRAVEVMHRVALRAEAELDYSGVLTASAPSGQRVEAVALAAVEIAEEVQASAILACTFHGWTVRRIARYRPRAPLLAVATSEELLRQLVLVWGTIPMLVEECDRVDQQIKVSLEAARETGLVKAGDTVVIAAGVPFGSPTNMILLQDLE